MPRNALNNHSIATLKHKVVAEVGRSRHWCLPGNILWDPKRRYDFESTGSTFSTHPHTVECMYLTSIGILLGALLSMNGFLWRREPPVILGKSGGGAVFVRAYTWLVWVCLHCKDCEKPRNCFTGLDGAVTIEMTSRRQVSWTLGNSRQGTVETSLSKHVSRTVLIMVARNRPLPEGAHHLHLSS